MSENIEKCQSLFIEVQHSDILSEQQSKILSLLGKQANIHILEAAAREVLAKKKQTTKL